MDLEVKKEMKLVHMAFVCILCMGYMIPAMAQDPKEVTIQQVQQRQGVADGDRVRVIGIAPAPTSRWGYTKTFIIDAAGGPYSGIMIYDAGERLAAEQGDRCEVVGLVEEYFDKTEINTTAETEFPPVILGKGTIPPAIEVTCSTAGREEYECCLIMIRNPEVMGPPDQYGNIPINDGTGEFVLQLRMRDPVPPVGTIYDCLTGINDYSFEEFKIRPRDENDWSCGGGPSPTPTQPGEPTATPGGPTPTPSPTPPGGACDLTFSMYFENHDPQNCFVAGDNFFFRALISNPCLDDKHADLYVALEVTGLFFFFPTWVQYPNITSAEVIVRADEQQLIDIVPAFDWPSGVGSLSDLHFYGFLTVVDTYNIIGDLQTVTFCYN